MKKLALLAASVVTVAGFAMPGFASAQVATGTTVGANSPVSQTVKDKTKKITKEYTKVEIDAKNSLKAKTGDVTVAGVGVVGSVASGTALADGTNVVGNEIDNSDGCGCPSTASTSGSGVDASTVGANSPVSQTVKSKSFEYTKTVTKVDIDAKNYIKAKSGDVTVAGVGVVGNVTSGDAVATGSNEVVNVIHN